MTIKPNLEADGVSSARCMFNHAPYPERNFVHLENYTTQCLYPNVDTGDKCSPSACNSSQFDPAGLDATLSAELFAAEHTMLNDVESVPVGGTHDTVFQQTQPSDDAAMLDADQRSFPPISSMWSPPDQLTHPPHLGSSVGGLASMDVDSSVVDAPFVQYGLDACRYEQAGIGIGTHYQPTSDACAREPVSSAPGGQVTSERRLGPPAGQRGVGLVLWSDDPTGPLETRRHPAQQGRDSLRRVAPGQFTVHPWLQRYPTEAGPRQPPAAPLATPPLALPPPAVSQVVYQGPHPQGTYRQEPQVPLGFCMHHSDQSVQGSPGVQHTAGPTSGLVPPHLASVGRYEVLASDATLDHALLDWEQPTGWANVSSGWGYRGGCMGFEDSATGYYARGIQSLAYAADDGTRVACMEALDAGVGDVTETQARGTKFASQGVLGGSQYAMGSPQDVFPARAPAPPGGGLTRPQPQMLSSQRAHLAGDVTPASHNVVQQSALPHHAFPPGAAQLATPSQAPPHGPATESYSCMGPPRPSSGGYAVQRWGPAPTRRTGAGQAYPLRHVAAGMGVSTLQRGATLRSATAAIAQSSRVGGHRGLRVRLRRLELGTTWSSHPAGRAAGRGLRIGQGTVDASGGGGSEEAGWGATARASAGGGHASSTLRDGSLPGAGVGISWEDGFSFTYRSLLLATPTSS